MLQIVVFNLVISAVASWVFLYALIPHLRRNLIDQPNARSSHFNPTPRGGGVVFVLMTAVAGFLALLGFGISSLQQPQAALPLVALPLAVVGFIDDRYSLPASWRYAVQLLISALLFLLSPLPLPWFALPVVIVAATAVINFTNFMDGHDGLVAGSMAVAISALALQLMSPWPLWVLVGALLGFLLWNWCPAKVFMGDVGSTFLGAVFAGLVLQAPSWPEALCLLLVLTPLLGDAGICVARRLLAGQRVFHAHRLHLYQRLHQAGWTHTRVSSLYITATAVLSMALIAGGWPWVVFVASAELILGAWLDQRIAVHFDHASQG